MKNILEILRIPNIILNNEDLEKHSNQVLTPLLINFTQQRKYVLILLDLKTNKILAHTYLEKPWRSHNLINYIIKLIKDKIIVDSKITFHVLKQAPFTTKGFTCLIFSINYILSFYARHETIPRISNVRTFFRKYVEYEDLNNKSFSEIVDIWNKNIYDKLDILDTPYKNKTYN